MGFKNPSSLRSFVGNLLLVREFTSHYAEAEDSADEDGKFSIGFKATFDRSHSPTKLKATSRVSKSLTDEIETSVPDPSQPDLL